jgi:hypothetical protein
MKSLYLVVLLLLTGQAAPARTAEPSFPTETLLTGLVSTINRQCGESKESVLRDLEAESDLLLKYQKQMGRDMICTCMPEQAKALLGRLPKRERARRISEHTLQTKYMPEINGACAGQGLRTTYAGACAERFAGRVPDSAAYCSCMSQFTSGMSDAEASQLGQESADWTEQAAAAKARGEAAPASPPTLSRMTQAHQACSAGRKAD